MVVAWGDNHLGQANVPSGLSNVVAGAIAGGDYHSLAITLGPFILSKPAPAIPLATGSGTDLSVAVFPGSSFGCQWSLNGVPIAGATETNLVISNFDLPKAGVYSVILQTNTVMRLSSASFAYPTAQSSWSMVLTWAAARLAARTRRRSP